MADVQINEVQTDVEITESAGAPSAAEIKKLLATVMEHLKAQHEHEERRRADDTIQDHAYLPEGND